MSPLEKLLLHVSLINPGITTMGGSAKDPAHSFGY
jgi:hypothetical protein